MFVVGVVGCWTGEVRDGPASHIPNHKYKKQKHSLKILKAVASHFSLVCCYNVAEDTLTVSTILAYGGDMGRVNEVGMGIVVFNGA